MINSHPDQSSVDMYGCHDVTTWILYTNYTIIVNMTISSR